MRHSEGVRIEGYHATIRATERGESTEFQVRYKPSPYIFNSEANWKSTAGR
jgi:hypothetical protein